MKFSDKIIKKVRDESQIVGAMYDLSDLDLGVELLKLSRSARQSSPELSPTRWVYDDAFVWHVIPELAFRLGVTDFERSERGDLHLREFDALRFRAATYNYLCFSSNREGAEWDILLREPANGNPVCFALDRICPGDIASPDQMTKRLIEIARYRGVEFSGVWTPSFKGKFAVDEDLGYAP